jgi:transaldolase
MSTINPRLKALTDAGVSVWLDQIRRSWVREGELARMVAEDSLRGLTSNPSIFEKAILESDDYLDELEHAARDDLAPSETFERLAIADLRGAADVLAGVHREAGGRDGFVSMEVMPDLAHDTEATLEAARRYWRELDRPNVLIKIPGTPEGVPAIEEAVYEGININVTLLFAVSAYEAVAEAYIRGLERRHAEGKSVDVNSVASFFVSRVDSATDRRLKEIGRDDLLGLAAVANARNAYAHFKQIFAGPRWDRLAHAGAAVQRPLWASTGTKDPRYSDVKYVDELIAQDTVNTMPLATLEAFADHGEVAGATAEIDPSAELAALADAGIDLDEVTDELLRDGVRLFCEAIERLYEGIEERREAIVKGAA